MEEKIFHREISNTIILPLLGYGENLLLDARAHNLRLYQLLKPSIMEVSKNRLQKNVLKLGHTTNLWRWFTLIHTAYNHTLRFFVYV